MLYPEQMLFQRFFPITVDGAPLGAIPLFMLQNPFHGMKGTGFANLMDHIPIRLTTPTCQTSKDPNYQGWMFGLSLNRALNFSPIRRLAHRGVEFVTPQTRSDGVNVRPETGGLLEFDEVDCRKKVGELAAMVEQTGFWDYFVTVTCNDDQTPGVSSLVRLLKRKYRRPEYYIRAYQTYLQVIVRLWHRFVKYLLRWISTSKERPLGPVAHYFARWEFQDGKGRGNKPHLHMGITLEKSAEQTTDRMLRRIANCDTNMWAEERETIGHPGFRMGTSPEDAVRNGLVEDQDEYEEKLFLWEKLQV
jgi:hypothetical protein